MKNKPKNTNLQKAKNKKNDEFYTQLKDIEREISHYKNQLKNKVIYCNCDNPEWSNFWKYFKDNFKDLGIKKLVSTYYEEGSKTYKTVFNGKNTIKTALNENGDFRSDECVEILKEVDIVITNPPFSLFREFVATIMNQDKDFIIIGPKNAITYKEIFPFIKKSNIRLGKNDGKGTMWFKGTDEQLYSVASYWFTNIKNPNLYKWLHLSESYSHSKYPKYDNYDAINVNKVVEIPHDYRGIMGVPITFLASHNPEQFEIVGEFNHGSDNEFDLAKPSINKKDIFKRIAIKKIHKEGATPL